MNKVYESIIKNTVSGKIDKTVATDLLKMLKQSENKPQNKEIAIIGMAAKFPKASNINEYYENLRNGVDCITEFPEERIRDIEGPISIYTNTKKEDLKYIKAGFLDRIDEFDYKFFQLAPKEANLMDPDQRLFLQTAYHALEDAGYGGDALKNSNTGMYVGFTDLFSYKNILAVTEPESAGLSVAGNTNSIIASRLSYLLNFNGPAIVVDTACSSSLVAVHLACKGLIDGDCEQAIAGGVRIRFVNVEKEEGIGIESKDCRARAFDDAAQGTSWGEGVGAVLLKPLDKAVRDGDNIYAVIKGSAINNDGTSIGILAPNVISQMDVMLKAWSYANIDPKKISYIESHGTGTKLGDPIEIDAIQRAFRKYTDRNQFCGIGSVKPNIGHLDCASGISGLIKAVLSLKNKELLPSIHFNIPNKNINFEKSPLYVNSRLNKWEENGEPLICGVSSFGFSGTNCHVVLEEFKSKDEEVLKDESKLEILTISAKNENTLKVYIEEYRDFVRKNELHLSNLCYTANTGRGHHPYRIAIVFNTKSELMQKLEYMCINDLNSIKNEGIYYSQQKNTIKQTTLKHDEISAKEEIKHLCHEINSSYIEKKLEDKYERGLFESLANYYTMGFTVLWKEIYNKTNRRKISIPKYPFEQNRCWVDINRLKLNNIQAGRENSSLPKSQLEDSIFEIKWIEDKIDRLEEEIKDENILIFKDKLGLGSQLGSVLREQNNVIEIEMGAGYYKHSETLFEISNLEEDYYKLMSDLKKLNINRIVHLISLKPEGGQITSIEQLEQSKNNGVLSLLYLAKSIAKNNIKNELDLFVVSEYGHEVTGTETNIYPENAMIYGISKVINSEFSNLKCRYIDIDSKSNVEIILKELTRKDNTNICVYRNCNRFVEEFSDVNMPLIEDREFIVKEGGVYIITGGMGGIGIEVAKYLSAKKKVNIILIGRSNKVETSMWRKDSEVIHNETLKHRIDSIRQIESGGSNVIYYNADVSQKEELEAVILNIRKQYGEIHGIVHGAGIAGDGIILRKDSERFKKVLSPKVNGTWLLNDLTREDNLDFFILFSSTASLIGAQGQSDYTAANAYLDSFVSLRKREGKNTVTINWTTWKEVGMAVEYGVNVDGLFKALLTEEAIHSFDKILHKDIARAIVGKINFDNKEIYKNMEQFPIRFSSELNSRVQEAYDEDERESKVIVIIKEQGKEEISDVEYIVASIWNKLLGISEFSRYDNFFELGGNSITAVKLEVELEKNNFNITNDDIYRYQTIKELADFIENKIECINDNDTEIEIKETCLENKSLKALDSLDSDKKILDNIEPFNDIFYVTCFNNGLFSAIRHFNQSPLTIMVNDIMLYSYDKKKSKFIDIEYVPQKKLKELMDIMRINVEHTFISTDIVTDIRNSIIDNKPLIIRLDCFYMKLRQDVYNKEHLDHNVLFYGYDDKNKLFHIIEHNNRDSLTYEKHVVSYEEIEKCYNGYLTYYGQGKNKPTLYQFSLSQKAFEENCKVNDCKSIFVENIVSNKIAIEQRLEEFKLFAEDLKSNVLEDSLSIEELSESVEKLNSVINSKIAFKYMLDNIFVPDNMIFDDIKIILEKWMYIRRVIAKIVFSNRYNKEKLLSLFAVFEEIYQKEIELLHKIVEMNS